ncbi:MAG: HD domain-containing protein, partial [Firmicutes bacterium]|nr:HD domain-containing protein [Bacillota bacterium]
MQRQVEKRQFASELRVGTIVNSVFMCADIKVRQTRAGSSFAEVRLVDRTGDISLKLWNYSESATPGLEPGVLVRLKNAPVTEYAGSLQLSMDSAQFGGAITICAAGECDLADFIPATTRDIHALRGELEETVASVTKKPVRCLLQSFFGDSEFVAKFCEWPAAVKHHHAYFGGLLEHTVSVLRICRCAAEQYDYIDWDLLAAGALLHDIGKLGSYAYDRTRAAATMAPAGVMEDHIMIGADAVGRHISALANCSDRARCDSPDPCWDADMTLRMSHLIVSHHGALEWGSPVVPSTIEACVLHYADNMDAQVNKFERTIREAPPGTDGQYRYSEVLGKIIYIPPDV